MGFEEKTMENVDKKLCLNNAKAFYKTAGLIDKVCVDFHDEMLAPLVMNLNFACELFLKYLLMDYCDYYTDIKNVSHSLSNLFDKLEDNAPEIAKKISSQYEKERGQWNCLSLVDLLKIEENNFSDFRYMHEKKHNVVTYTSNMNACVYVLLQVCSDNGKGI